MRDSEAIRGSLGGQGQWWGSVGTKGRGGGSCILIAGVLGDGGMLLDVGAGHVGSNPLILKCSHQVFYI